jgi:hypothetical protein
MHTHPSSLTATPRLSSLLCVVYVYRVIHLFLFFIRSINQSLLDIPSINQSTITAHIPCKGKEGFFNANITLCTSLQELDSILIYTQSINPRQHTSQRLPLFFRNHLFLQHITLVPHEDLVDAFSRMLLNITDPVSDIVEASIVGYVVRQEDSHGAAVVGGRDCSESFLTGRILILNTGNKYPDLQLDSLSIQFNSPNFKVNTDSRDKRGREGIIREPE